MGVEGKLDGARDLNESFSVNIKWSMLSLCILDASGFVRCWYVWGRQCVWRLKEARNSGKSEVGKQRQTLCLSVSPSGEQAATGGSDSAIHLYDLNTQQRKQTCKARYQHVGNTQFPHHTF